MSATIDAQRLHHLLVFAAIVREGSMTAAARSLGVSRSVVSAHLRSLETSLGVRLLERTTRRMSLTQVGEEILAAATRMLEAAEDAGAAAETESQVVTGQLRVACPVDLWVSLLRPVVRRLCSEHPDLRVEILSGDARVDLIADRLDVAIRVGVPVVSSHVMRKLGEDDEIIVASPALAQQWEVEDLNELAEAPWIAHRHVPHTRLVLRRGKEEREVRVGQPRVVVGATDMLRGLAIDGLGLCVIPRHMARDDLRAGRLVRLLPAWRLRRIEVYALMPSRRYPRRTAVFLDTLQAVLEESRLMPDV